MNGFLYFPRKWFQLHHSKICKQLNNALLKRSEQSVFSWTYLYNLFLRSFLRLNFDLNNFERFASLSRKMVPTSSPKIVKKNWKMTFPNAHNICFLSSRSIQKHFLRRLLWPNFDLDSFERFALLFQEMVSTSSPKNLPTAE